MKMRKDKDFISFFDEATGHCVQSGIIKNGVESSEDPFMTSFPELLDVGIMGHCKHGQSGLCLEAGVECYQDGLHANAPNMALKDFEEIVRQCRGKTYQIALGGCGDPDQHEHFAEILEICHQAGIVPNFTTSGLGLNSELAVLCKKYCGAMAVSWYRSSYTLRAIDLLLQTGVKTNIHYVISNSTIEEAITRLKECSFDNQSKRWAVDLRTHTILEAWDSPAFEAFRNRLRQSCPDCEHRLACMGATPSVLKLCCAKIAVLKVVLLARWPGSFLHYSVFRPCSHNKNYVIIKK